MSEAIQEKKEVATVANGFMSIIEKAAALDNLDVDKLERMMAMQMQWEEREMKKRFDEARARVSKRLSNIKVVKNRKVAYDIDKNDKKQGQKEAFRYAALEDIDKLIRPALDEENITVSYDTEPCALAGWHTIVCWLSFGGHREAYRIPMPLDTSGGKGNAQAMGSTQMYGMRRALCGALNIIPVGIDNDGADIEFLDNDKAVEIDLLITEVKADKDAFLKYMGVDSVPHIRANEYNKAKSMLLKKKNAKGTK